MRFVDRVTILPRLGLGVSTEYGAGDAPQSLDVLALHDAHPGYARFLEIGVEAAKGLDRHAQDWVARGLPTTYHYLDVNLDEPEDFDEGWLESLQPALADLLGCAAGGCTRAELIAEARRHGAEPGEAAEIVAHLVDDGLLR